MIFVRILLFFHLQYFIIFFLLDKDGLFVNGNFNTQRLILYYESVLKGIFTFFTELREAQKVRNDLEELSSLLFQLQQSAFLMKKYINRLPGIDKKSIQKIQFQFR